MARRRGKSISKQDDSWLALDSPTGQSSRSFNEYVLPGVLLLIIAVCGTGLGWVCSDHQQMIDSLSETLASMQGRITKLQQQLGPDNAQITSVGGFEERIMALEDSYAKAQKQVELALATSEQIKSKDLQNKMWSLQTEMNNKLAELQQNTFSIAALNAIIKNKSVEFEVLKQSVNTMLSANAELAIQISGFASTLSVTKLRLDEQISFVDGLMSQLEGQKKEINQIKELFDSNQETLAINTQELMDIKELVESEQIRRTQKIERHLKYLYKRLEDHQMTTESLHFHLTAQIEALKTQQSSIEKELQVEDQVKMSENRDSKAPKKRLENIEGEFELENAEKIGEDQAKEKDEFIIEQDSFEKDKTSEKPVEEPVKEIQTLKEPDIETEKMVTKKQKEMYIIKATKTSQDTRVAKNEIKKIVVADVQTSLEDSNVVNVETVKMKDKKDAVYPAKTSIIANETENQVEVPAAEETLFEDFNTARTDIEEAAGEKQEELLSAKESSENLETLSDKDNQHSFEEHAAEEIEDSLNELLTADGTAEQELGSDIMDIKILLDDTITNGKIGNKMRDNVPSKVEQEAEEEITSASAKKNESLKLNEL